MKKQYFVSLIVYERDARIDTLLAHRNQQTARESLRGPSFDDLYPKALPKENASRDYLLLAHRRFLNGGGLARKSTPPKTLDHNIAQQRAGFENTYARIDTHLARILLPPLSLLQMMM